MQIITNYSELINAATNSTYENHIIMIFVLLLLLLLFFCFCFFSLRKCQKKITCLVKKILGQPTKNNFELKMLKLLETHVKTNV